MSMRPLNRRSAPSVKHGRVQKKNNWVCDGRNYLRRVQSEVCIERRRPGEGYRHLVTVADLRAFIDIIPGWDLYSGGLDAVVFAEGSGDNFGWYRNRVIYLRPWPREMWGWVAPQLLASNDYLFPRLNLDLELDEADGWYYCRWTESQARAFQLLDVFLHELGHHVDRQSSKRQLTCGRGEPYAEVFASVVAEEMWDAYLARFGAP